MLFSSPEFLFGFLPGTVIAAFLAYRFAGPRASLALLVVASLVFYGWWNPAFLALLAGSIVVNYLVGARLQKAPSSALLALGVTFNLGLLCYFKYVNFFIATVNDLTGSGFSAGDIVLPLAISFFTFQQIAYLVDARRGLVHDTDPLRYALFVSFFPQLIAGPIVHHSEMMPQFADKRGFGFRRDDLLIGLSIFSIGMYKKVVIADTLAQFADPVFAAPAGSVGMLDAWIGVLSYTFQIYFDFSGYSDMAIGLARMFGIRLPLNFHAPYKAHNIIEFWRCWHITLSRFLRDYLYIPLGGNRKGGPRRYANLMIVMLLGGLWHGAGWNFVLWGGLHGAYLAINHGWRALCRQRDRDPDAAGIVSRWAGRLLTFLAVVVAWVFFRSQDFTTAIGLLQSMIGLTGGSTDATYTAALPWLAGALVLAWFAPTTQEIMARFGPALKDSLSRFDVRVRGGAVAVLSRVEVLTPAVLCLSMVAVLIILARGAKLPPFIYMVF